MTKIAELEKEIWRITEIFLNAKENFNYSYYLHKPDTTEEAEYVKHDRDLIFIRHSLWRLSIIELSKLFSNNTNTHKFNLSHFISKLKPGGHFSNFQIDPLKIAEWEKAILTKQELIKNIITLRDKIYAHTDPNKDDYRTVEIFFTQIESLFDLVEGIIKEINLVALESDDDISTPTFERNDFTMIKTLSEVKRKEIDEILKYIKK